MQHLNKIRIWLSVCTLVIVSGSMLGCEKDTIVHENLIIENNTPPENNNVSTLQLSNYINNVYIDLFGRAPTEGELEADISFLRTNGISTEARGEWIAAMMNNYEYYKNINVLTNQKMLVDVDSITVIYKIELYEYFIELNNLGGDTLTNPFWEYEIYKLQQLLTAPVDLYEGTIGIDSYMARFIYNAFYDEVNMGSLNFVIACFENLYGRAPTDEELDDGIRMVDGASSQLFLIDGSSKEDFIHIATTHPEFFQGQVFEVFTTLLAREPDSYEMFIYTSMMMESNHFNDVKQIILQGEEYAGF